VVAGIEVAFHTDFAKSFARIEVVLMPMDFDVIVVGSGPAGVSSALPLVEAGLRVLMVDGGRALKLAPISKPYLEARLEDEQQWEWMIGQDYHAIRQFDAVSPKLRVPIYAPVFEGYHAANKIEPKDFVAVGSLARGGLSNAWGCGVARLSAEELRDYPFPPGDIEKSYEIVTRRMGVSGANHDDLVDYFGLDAWADSPIPMDALQTRLVNRYDRKKAGIADLGFRLGRSRVAALSRDRGERQACNLTGNCLWGCSRRALYSATDDLERLKRHANFTYRSGFVVERVVQLANGRAVEGGDASGHQTLTAKKIILAAGTFATTRLALQAIQMDQPVAMQTCPTAAFILWLPAVLGTQRQSAFSLGQLSFVLSLANGVSGFGSLYNPTGIPLAEFVRYMPFQKRYGIDFLKALMSSCVVGNMFLPGRFSTATLALDHNGALKVGGVYHPDVAGFMQFAERRLRKVFWKLGALLLPKSFTVGRLGSDIHYSSSLPMRLQPKQGETNEMGELFGCKDVYIVDGASLSSLSEKSHTLTIMANADRIGRRLVAQLSGAA
jgi:choline dehydrogenase-like flavoprotein